MSVILTVASDLTITLNQRYLAVQGEIVALTITPNAALKATGNYLYLDFLLPDGSIVSLGGFDLDLLPVTFPLTLCSGLTISGVASNLVLARHGMVVLQAVVATVGRGQIIKASNRLFLPVYPSVQALSGVADPPPPVTNTDFLYLATYNTSGYSDFNSIGLQSLTIVLSASKSVIMYNLTKDASYLYGEGSSDRYLAKYDPETLVAVDTLDLGATSHLLSMVTDDLYIFLNYYDGTNYYIGAYDKADFSLMKRITTAAKIEAFMVDAGYSYIYTQGQLVTRLKYMMTMVDYVTLSMEDPSIATKDTFVYVSGRIGSNGRLYKMQKNSLYNIGYADQTGYYYTKICFFNGVFYAIRSDWKLVILSADDMSETLVVSVDNLSPYSLAYHDGFIYVGNNSNYKVMKFNATTLAYVASSDASSDHIMQMVADVEYDTYNPVPI